jgi:sirohydrochlorin ferrochelatase
MNRGGNNVPEGVEAVQPGVDEVGIVLIAHGSRHREANDELFDVAERFRTRGYRRVFAAFLELAEPGILEAGERCVASGAQRVVLTPYFLSAGRHATCDLEAARQELAERYPHVGVLLAAPLGPHPLLDEILRQRVADAVRSE